MKGIRALNVPTCTGQHSSKDAWRNRLMGEQNVNALDERQRKAFTKALLNEVVALENMLKDERFETGVRRIGAEQEMFFVDENLHAAPVVMQVLEKLDDPRLTTELAQFNIEANLNPRVFGGDCLRQMEAELQGLVDTVRESASNSEPMHFS